MCWNFVLGRQGHICTYLDITNWFLQKKFVNGLIPWWKYFENVSSCQWLIPSDFREFSRWGLKSSWLVICILLIKLRGVFFHICCHSCSTGIFCEFLCFKIFYLFFYLSFLNWFFKNLYSLSMNIVPAYLLNFLLVCGISFILFMVPSVWPEIYILGFFFKNSLQKICFYFKT